MNNSSHYWKYCGPLMNLHGVNNNINYNVVQQFDPIITVHFLVTHNDRSK